MPTLRPLIALFLLSLLAATAVQPAAAASGAYSGPGTCGGTAPIALACASQHVDVPSSASGVYISVGYDALCPVPCEFGTVRIDVQVTGFTPTSYDPAYVATATCWFTDGG